MSLLLQVRDSAKLIKLKCRPYMWFDPDRTKKRRLNKIGQSVYTERLAQSPNIRNESWQHDSSYLSVEKLLMHADPIFQCHNRNKKMTRLCSFIGSLRRRGCGNFYLRRRRSVARNPNSAFQSSIQQQRQFSQVRSGSSRSTFFLVVTDRNGFHL